MLMPPSMRGPVTEWTLILAVCLAPYGIRLGAPSLYADDIARLEQLQTSPLPALLFAPFNEHLAPLFQGLSWLTWQLAGRSLAAAPLAFTLMSFLPLPLALGLIALVVRRETGSATAARVGVAVFSLSWLAIETVYWYSASSFLWALVATLAAWLGARSSVSNGGGRRGWIVSAVGAAAAPAFSAIGLLAGPIAALRAISEPARDDQANTLRSRSAAVVAPLLGTVVYLAIGAGFRYHAVLASSLDRNVRLGPGLLAAGRAPVEVLLPALVGLSPSPASGSGIAGTVGLSLLIGLGLLRRAWRRPSDRPLILGGLALVAGGYALAFCARAGEPGHSVLQTQRYHLFPMLGLVLLLAGLFRRGLAWFDARPRAGLGFATGVALLLLVTHLGEIRGRARFLRYPDQVRTLAAVDRLGATCARLGVTRAQAIAALDPVETEWTPAGYPVLVMLPPCATSTRLADDRVKPALLAALSAEDRRSLCGGMDATPYLQSAEDAADAVAVGRAVRLYRVRTTDDGRLDAEGWPAFVEFEMSGSDPSAARWLELPGEAPEGLTEVWWRGPAGRWSETRSVRLRPERSSAPGTAAWRLPLDRLPHWDPSEAGRIRILFHQPGRLATAPAPRLVR